MISRCFRETVEKSSLFDHMDAVLLIVDELVDNGYELHCKHPRHGQSHRIADCHYFWL